MSIDKHQNLVYNIITETKRNATSETLNGSLLDIVLYNSIAQKEIFVKPNGRKFRR